MEEARKRHQAGAGGVCELEDPVVGGGRVAPHDGVPETTGHTLGTGKVENFICIYHNETVGQKKKKGERLAMNELQPSTPSEEHSTRQLQGSWSPALLLNQGPP